MSCWSHIGQPAMLHLCCFLTKVFPFILPPSLLLACGAAQGPPDAYRQMSLVEQNMLCLTSHEATGLLRKLKGCLLSIDRSLKGTLVFFTQLVSSVTETFWSSTTQSGLFQRTDVTRAYEKNVCLSFQKSSKHFPQKGWIGFHLGVRATTRS